MVIGNCKLPLITFLHGRVYVVLFFLQIIEPAIGKRVPSEPGAMLPLKGYLVIS